MINKRLKMPNFPKFVEVSEIWTAGAAHRVAAGKCCGVLNYDLEWFLPTKIKDKPPIRKWTIPAFPLRGWSDVVVPPSLFYDCKSLKSTSSEKTPSGF